MSPHIKPLILITCILALLSFPLVAAASLEVRVKEAAPIVTSYGYELGRAQPGNTFRVEETRDALAFGFYATPEGGIRGYISLSALEMTKGLEAFVRAQESRREKLREAVDKKEELGKLPQPPGKTLTKYVEEKEKDFMTVGGVMLESVTWTKDKSPYLITDPVYVPSGVILFIDPGVEVYARKSRNPGARISSGEVNGIIVAGNILAIGRPDQVISLRGFEAKPEDRNTWGGVTVLDSADPGNIFRWAIFENAATAISCGRGSVISNCIFRYNYSGLLLNEQSETASVFNNLFLSNATGLEVRGTPARAEVYNNIFAFNAPNGGIRAWRNPEAMVAYNNMYRNAQDYMGWSPYSTDIRVNPMFTDLKNGDYHLNPLSPLLGRGRGGSNIGLFGGRDAVRKPRSGEEEEETTGEDSEVDKKEDAEDTKKATDVKGDDDGGKKDDKKDEKEEKPKKGFLL